MNSDIERAIQAFNSGAWDEAKALCAAELERDSANPHALLLLGHIHAAAGDSATAEPLLARARRAAPPDKAFLASLGAAYSLALLDDEAREALQAALQLDPHLPRALFGLGNICYRAGEWDAAKQLFERALARRADFAPALAALADLSMRENRDDEAYALANKAAAIAPGLPAAQLTLAEIALSRRSFAETLSAADQVLAAWDVNPQQRGAAMDLRARALEGLKRYDEAFAAFEQSNENAHALATRTDFAGHALAPERLERIIAFLGGEDHASWPKPPRTPGPRLCFLSASRVPARR